MTRRESVPLPSWFWIVEFMGGCGGLLVSVLMVAEPGPMASALDWVEAFVWGVIAVLFFASAVRRWRTGSAPRGWYVYAVFGLVALWVVRAIV